MIRQASLADAQELLALCNEHEKRVYPDFEPLPLSEIEEAIRGPYEPGHPLVLEVDGEVRAVVFIQTFTSRKRVEPDMFTIGTDDQTRELFEAAMVWIRENRKGFELRAFCNTQDSQLLGIFQDQGLRFQRDYYKLIKRPIAPGYPGLPDGVEIRNVDFFAESKLLHSLKNQSFEGHFGYILVSHDEWVREREQEENSDPSGCFVLFENDEAAGFLIASDSRRDLNGGWVDLLGVLKEFRGKGYGRYLLDWGIAYSASKGYDSIGLSADTGNESGALALYENAGFKPDLVWRSHTTTI
jgi:ribosomal protein S18 acetylase RimI-like enzyme